MPLRFSAAAMKASILDAVAEDLREEVLPLSNEYAPKDTETMVDSGRVVIDGSRVVLTYGLDTDRNPKTGEASNTYVVEVHENMEAHHRTGGAKFAQRAMDEKSGGMAERVARRVKL